MPAANHAHKHQLKPCPFCGSTDLTLDHLVDNNDWFVSCNICEIQEIANYTRAQAVALWNRRAPMLAEWAPLAKALFQLERDPNIKDQAWFDFQGKAQRILAALNSQST